MKLTEKHLAELRRFRVRSEDEIAGVTIATHRANRFVRELLAAGLVEYMGWVNVDDGDGFTVRNANGSERQRPAYKTTPAGIAALEKT